jgi:hypothetical protein
VGGAAILAGRRLGLFLTAVLFNAALGHVAGALGAGFTLVAILNALAGPVGGGVAAALDALIGLGAVRALAVRTLAIGALAIRTLTVGTLTVRPLTGVTAALVILLDAGRTALAETLAGISTALAAVAAIGQTGLEGRQRFGATVGDTRAGLTLVGQVALLGVLTALFALATLTLHLISVALALGAQSFHGLGFHTIQGGVERIDGGVVSRAVTGGEAERQGGESESKCALHGFPLEDASVRCSGGTAVGVPNGRIGAGDDGRPGAAKRA